VQFNLPALPLLAEYKEAATATETAATLQHCNNHQQPGTINQQRNNERQIPWIAEIAR